MILVRVGGVASACAAEIAPRRDRPTPSPTVYLKSFGGDAVQRLAVPGRLLMRTQRRAEVAASACAGLRPEHAPADASGSPWWLTCSPRAGGVADEQDPWPRIVVRRLGIVGKVLLGIGLVVACGSAVALIVTAIAFRGRLHDAVDGMKSSGTCLGVRGGCLWLQRKLEAKR